MKKYQRLKEDPSQIQLFGDDVVEHINDDEGRLSEVEQTLQTKADLVDGRIPSSQLPSYVDDVVEYASLNDFPEEGEQGKIYLAIDTGLCYRWSGSEYIQVAGSTSVLMFASQSSFPAEGEEGVIYIAEDTNKQFRWNGTAYVELSAVEPLSAQDIADAIAISDVDPILNNNSWATIAAICAAGKAAEVGWQLGDTKTDVGTDGTTRTFRICDMQGLYGKHVVFEQVELENTSYVWQSTVIDGYHNNYSTSQMRTTRLPAILAKYSSELQSSITDTTYKVATNGNDGTLLDLTDKLFLPAEREIFASRSYSRTEEWDALTRYALYAANDTRSLRRKYKPGATSSDFWWLRSPYSGNTGSVCLVNSSGYANSGGAISGFGVAPCFSF